MTRRSIAFVHRGLLAGVVLVAFALLGTFYAVVSHAVDHAADKRAQVAVPASGLAAVDAPARTATGRRSVLLAGALP